ncbi:MAG TPA: sigma-70 family RNA polymerase sigma factor [Flavobacteriaceae bacterium]|nr:sigma-70 family RNA polymerase sigma factor [Flavobacteriaceae bacterium]
MPKNRLEPDKWVKRYANYMYNYTIVRVNDHEIAQDIVSETFLAALRSKNNFKGKSTERTWLIAILKHKIIDHYRRKNTIKGSAEVRVDWHDEEQEGDWLEQRVEDERNLNISDVIENKELGAAILECLDTLDETHAEIFRLRTIENYETEAICNEFDITPSNLWVIVHRARKAMMECLQKNWI